MLYGSKTVFSVVVISVEALSNDSATAISWPTDSAMKKRSFTNASLNNPSASIDIPADFVQSVGESSGIHS